MRKSAVFLALVGLILFGSVTTGWTGEPNHTIEVEKMTLQWTIKGDAVHIKLSGKTTGWIGIGFNPSREMKDANLILGYVKNDKVKVTDHFGTTTRQHAKDTKLGGKQDISEISGKEANGITEISFLMPLNSGDEKDTPLSADKEAIILLAYGAGRDSFRTKHQFKAVLKVDLKTGAFSRIK